MNKKLSAASLRAVRYNQGPEWYCELRTKAISV